MKRAFGLLAIAAALTIGVAVAAGPVKIQVPWAFLGGVNVGSTALTADKVTGLYAGSVLVDFDGGTLGCTTIAVGKAGPRQGDRCEMGSTTPYTANNSFLCNVTDAGEVTVTNCHLGVASDPASATYTFTVTSHL